MLRVTNLVQVLKELVESLLLQPKIHFERVMRRRSSNFNPAFGNVDPFVLHPHLLPAFVECERVRDGGLEGAKQSNSPK